MTGLLDLKARVFGIKLTELSETTKRMTIPHWMGAAGLERAVQGVIDDAWRKGKTVEVERPDERSAVLTFEDTRVEIRVRA